MLFTPAINRDIHALFLQQIADSLPQALHVVIADQAGFHLPGDGPRLPGNLRLLPLPPYFLECNPVERILMHPYGQRSVAHDPGPQSAVPLQPFFGPFAYCLVHPVTRR